jgi:hypothetical protein
MLAGIVAMQVEVLKLGASEGRSLSQSAALQSRNELLRASVSSLSNEQRIERLAAQMGMVMPPPGDVVFLPPDGTSNAGHAVSNISAPDATTFLAGLPTSDASDGLAASDTTSTAGDPTTGTVDGGATTDTTDPTGAAPVDDSTATPTDSGGADTSTDTGDTTDGTATGAVAPTGTADGTTQSTVAPADTGTATSAAGGAAIATTTDTPAG